MKTYSAFIALIAMTSLAFAQQGSTTVPVRKTQADPAAPPAKVAVMPATTPAQAAPGQPAPVRTVRPAAGNAAQQDAAPVQVDPAREQKNQLPPSPLRRHIKKVPLSKSPRAVEKPKEEPK